MFFVKNFIPVPNEYTEKEGLNYATTLADKAQFISLLLYILGWVLIMVGILLGVAGSVLGTDPVNTPNPEAWDRLLSQRGLICNTFAIIIAGLGRQFLERAKASARLASIATKAIASSSCHTILNNENEKTIDPVEADKNAYEACVMAKAVWVEGRVDDTQLNEILNKLGRKNSTNDISVKNKNTM